MLGQNWEEHLVLKDIGLKKSSIKDKRKTKVIYDI